MNQEIERLKVKENDLIDIYRRTYKRMFELGYKDIGEYMMAQIDDCPIFTVEEPDYKRMYYEEIDKRQVAINFIDQVLQYHLSPFDFKQVDKDINTLIGILTGYKEYTQVKEDLQKSVKQ